MTSGTTSSAGSGDGSSGSHRKGHRRQESMYAMTGLYSETVPEEETSDDNNDTQESVATTAAHFCHETVIKCHSRNPSTGFDRDKTAHQNTFHETPAVILRDTNDCGILKCRPSFIQRYAGIKVRSLCGGSQ